MNITLTKEQFELLLALLTYCQRNHPYYSKEAKSLYYEIANKQESLFTAQGLNGKTRFTEKLTSNA